MLTTFIEPHDIGPDEGGADSSTFSESESESSEGGVDKLDPVLAYRLTEALDLNVKRKAKYRSLRAEYKSVREKAIKAQDRYFSSTLKKIIMKDEVKQAVRLQKKHNVSTAKLQNLKNKSETARTELEAKHFKLEV
jgi:hypothetical protein